MRSRAFIQIHLPGLYYDEALDAIPAMQLLAGQPLDITSTFHLLGREWPLMVMTYVGPTTSYLVAPAFALFGVSVTVLRLVNIGLGVLTLALAWGLLNELFDAKVAGIAVLLLAVNPTFIFWSRLGAFVSLPMLPLAIGALWCLYRWRQRGQDRTSSWRHSAWASA
jgi:4-amino-4-deoxy-L-arabinose transferase-like glycosyltransferase